MRHQQILKKVLKKAVDNGLFIPKADNVLISNFARTYGKTTVYGWWTASVIFSHDFAKAFWGSGWLPGHGEHEWKVRLREMVVADDPIKYLEQFI